MTKVATGGSLSWQGSLGTMLRPWIGSLPDMDKVGRPCVATWKQCRDRGPILLCRNRELMKVYRDRKFRVATGLDAGAAECVVTSVIYTSDTARSAHVTEHSARALYT